MKVGKEADPLLYLSAQDSHGSRIALSGPNIANDGAYCFFRAPAGAGFLTGHLVTSEQALCTFSIPFEVEKVGIQMEIDSP
jgi:hypothetical protein